jgi:hypothetical protein
LCRPNLQLALSKPSPPDGLKRKFFHGVGRSDVRFASLADNAAHPPNVRFTPESGHSRASSPCPPWVNSGRDALKISMSALPPKADIRPRDQDVCFGPSADIA